MRAILILFLLQVEYLDENETNGYEIDLDEEPVLSCVVSTSGKEDVKKHNTCFTSGVIYLQTGN